MGAAIDDREYRALLEAISLRYGYDFLEYAESSLKRRISYFMENRKIDDVDKLEHMLLDDEQVFEEFVNDLSITVTEMFRDPPFYKQLREKIANRLNTYPVIKIWIAGCATGQEAYSIAILLREEGLLDRSIIYATDINQKSLAVAKEAVYPLEYMKKYTENYFQSGGQRPFSEYYTAHYNAAVFDQSLKNNIVFSAHNLVMDQSFNEFQLIVCRNVLLYFNHSLQNKVVNLFYKSLCTFGFLALGDKESLVFCDKREAFVESEGKQKIYSKMR
jgi:chemotaxis protein methyltransferase CheR